MGQREGHWLDWIAIFGRNGIFVAGRPGIEAVSREALWLMKKCDLVEMKLV
jgi:hypothetical protein